MSMVDLEKAYDNILLKDVLQVLSNNKIPREIIDLIENIYEEGDIINN